MLLREDRAMMKCSLRPDYCRAWKGLQLCVPVYLLSDAAVGHDILRRWSRGLMGGLHSTFLAVRQPASQPACSDFTWPGHNYQLRRLWQEQLPLLRWEVGQPRVGIQHQEGAHSDGNIATASTTRTADVGG